MATMITKNVNKATVDYYTKTHQLGTYRLEKNADGTYNIIEGESPKAQAPTAGKAQASGVPIPTPTPAQTQARNSVAVLSKATAPVGKQPARSNTLESQNFNDYTSAYNKMLERQQSNPDKRYIVYYDPSKDKYVMQETPKDAPSPSKTLATENIEKQIATPEDKALISMNAFSDIDIDKLYKERFEENKPYYERLLAESNYDINTAISRLEEDRVRQRKSRKEQADIDVKDLYQDVPQELNVLLRNLSRSGLLTTPQGPQDSTMSYTTTTGEKIAPNIQRQTYGGVAGKQIALLQSQQQARQQAIERALKNQEEESDILKQRTSSDLQVAQQRKKSALEQEHRGVAESEAQKKYSQKVQDTALKLGIVSSPFTGG